MTSAAAGNAAREDQGGSTAREAGRAGTAPESPVINIAAYRFVRLERLDQWRRLIREQADRCGLKGTVLLAPEGINLFVAGPRPRVEEFLTWLRAQAPFAGLEAKESPGDRQPFNRMLVRLKKEIISMGRPEIDPVAHPAPAVDPPTLKQWLDEGRDIVLLDTRNDYEVELGTFHGAVPAGIDHFRQFPDAVRRLPAELKDRTVVMFCTGGIRCEKAGPLMLREGFRNVFQLQGGILKYFEECGSAHYRGDCFVFDQRVAVTPELEEGDAETCFACQAVLTPAMQGDPRYQPPHACPQCHVDPGEAMRQSIAARHAALQVFAAQLPGAVPCEQVRPLNVPLRFDGATVLDLLDGMHPHCGRDYWLAELEGGLVRGSARIAGPAAVGDTRGACQPRILQAGDVVRAGWRIEHVSPCAPEPDVNAAIRIVHEDPAIVVVDKPAPLPVHASGRFHRNTLLWMLNQVYATEVLRPAHRLDANTTGLLVLSRSRAVARRLQPQFELGDVVKTYLARVHGNPTAVEFRCEVPIGRETTASGGRKPDLDGLSAVTLFRHVRELADGQSLIECRPLTGRTNQIRIHLAELGLPIVGDTMYGRTAGEESDADDGSRGPATHSVDALPLCLHAWKLEFRHPDSGEQLSMESPMPPWA